MFHEAALQPNETVDQYNIRLQRLAETCDFKNVHDEMIRDRLVLGCKDKAVRARLFRQKECTLHMLCLLAMLQLSEVSNTTAHHPSLCKGKIQKKFFHGPYLSMGLLSKIHWDRVNVEEFMNI